MKTRNAQDGVVGIALLLLMWFTALFAVCPTKAHGSEKSSLFPAKVGPVQLGGEKKKEGGQYDIVGKKVRVLPGAPCVFVEMSFQDKVTKQSFNLPFPVPTPLQKLATVMKFDSADVIQKGEMTTIVFFIKGEEIGTLNARLTKIPKPPQTI